MSDMKFKKGDYVLYQVGAHESICKIIKIQNYNFILEEKFVIRMSYSTSPIFPESFAADEENINMIDITSLLQMRCDLDRVINEIVSSREK